MAGGKFLTSPDRSLKQRDKRPVRT